MKKRARIHRSVALPKFKAVDVGAALLILVIFFAALGWLLGLELSWPF